ncbi:uncharacterized protein LOC124917407 [Impatiens glandulifera]|uniref:uncharacterized protein LOC124917407 n=1 Tax=Impatiens glandulifera TaxID=253017 RepID=UPI001FB09781|nr:uncharacterized protein LOC124917407 [Impatiens glandulifera]
MEETMTRLESETDQENETPHPSRSNLRDEERSEPDAGQSSRKEVSATSPPKSPARTSSSKSPDRQHNDIETDNLVSSQNDPPRNDPPRNDPPAESAISKEMIKACFEEFFRDTIAPWKAKMEEYTESSHRMIDSVNQRIETIEEGNAQTDSSLKAVSAQLEELIAAKMAADEVRIKENEIAALKIQEEENERLRILKEREQSDAAMARQVPEEENDEPTQNAVPSSTSAIHTTRAKTKKRKQAEREAAKRAQSVMDDFAELTGVSHVNLEQSDSDEDEENVPPLQKRTRVILINVKPLRAVSPSSLPQRSPAHQALLSTRRAPATGRSGNRASSSRPGYDPCTPGRGLMSN